MDEPTLTYLLDLNSLDGYRATFTIVSTDGIERPTLTIPHTQWATLGRPGRVTIEVSA